MKKENNYLKFKNNYLKFILGGTIIVILGITVYFSLIQPKISGFVISNEIEEQESEYQQFDNEEDLENEKDDEKDDEEKEDYENEKDDEKDDEEKEDYENEKDDEKDDKNDDKKTSSLKDTLIQEGYDVTYLETEENALETILGSSYSSYSYVLVSIKNETILAPIKNDPEGETNLEESHNFCEDVLPYIKEAYPSSEIWMIAIHDGNSDIGGISVLCTFSTPELNLGGCTYTSIPLEYYE